MKERSFETACGNRIYVTDRSVRYMQNCINILDLLKEAFSNITLPVNEKELCTAIDFGKKIGKTNCVIVSHDAELNFAVRKNKTLCQTPLRVVVGVEGQETSQLTVIASERRGRWKLKIAYFGSLGPRMPNDPCFKDKRSTSDFKDALNFWREHALLWDHEIMEAPYQSTWEEELRK